MKKFFKFDKIFGIALSAVLAVTIVGFVANAATTISTDINTGGALTVSGISTLTGGVTGGLTVNTGGATITAGGLTITAGGETITAGGLTVSGATGTTTFATKFSIGTSTPDYTSLFTFGTSTERAIFQHPVTGYFGVGTTAPGTLLAVRDGISANATSTFNGIRLTAGGINLQSLLSCGASVGLVIDANGNLSCGNAFGKSWEINAFGVLAPTTTLSVFLPLRTYASSTIFADGGITSASSTATSTFTGKFSIGSSTPDYTSLFTFGTGTVNSLFQNPVTGNIGYGTTSPGEYLSVVGDALFSSAATTSLIIQSTGTKIGGCIQLTGSDGTPYRLIATSSSAAIWMPGSCQSQL